MIETVTYEDLKEQVEVLFKNIQDKKICVYPFGQRGKAVYGILMELGVDNILLLDEFVSKKNPKIKSLEYCEELNSKEYAVFFAHKSENLRYLIKSAMPDADFYDLNIRFRTRNCKIMFLEEFSELCRQNNIQGNVAECGVYKGIFAWFINRYFYDRKLYLVDPYKGFSESDSIIERSMFHTFVTDGLEKRFHDTSIELVKKQLLTEDNVEFIQGYVPEAIHNLKDTFCFVNLDMDMYKPTYEALKIFYPQMAKGGIILIHDYFNYGWPGIKKAVVDYEALIQKKLYKLSIGDCSSIAIVKD